MIHGMRNVVAIAALAGIAGAAHATVYFSQDFKALRCGSPVSDIRISGGVPPSALFDNWEPTGSSTVECAAPPIAGKKYLTWSIPDRPNNAGVEVDAVPATIEMGKTYYLAYWIRFDKGLADIWHTGTTAYSFDKSIEFQGTGFRWGIGAGWDGWYSYAPVGKFTFDVWYATSVLGEHGDDHKPANVAPYSGRAPYLAEYGKWYGVVMGVTAQSNDNGRVQLWINGTRTHDYSVYTANPGAKLTKLIAHGTIAQPAYDAPAHKRSSTGWLVTDNWADVQAGGYLQDPAVSKPATAGTQANPTAPTR
ncbi:MAG: hypothetical protein WBP72_00700 [Rhodocyclaceae bacterium]